MNILFIGYGKTSRRVAKLLFQQGHKITTISRHPKSDPYANHLIQDIYHLDLSDLPNIDVVYVLLAPDESTIEAYEKTYLKPIQYIAEALERHSIQRVIVVSSTSVYGEQHGESVTDHTPIYPQDEKAQILWQMEQQWSSLYTDQLIIVRPSGIYGESIKRWLKLAKNTKHYPTYHWSNRIHIDDLARFLALLCEHKTLSQSYIVSNHQPLPFHEILWWFQQQLNLPLTKLTGNEITGKKLYADRMLDTGFQLEHPICFNDYLKLLKEHGGSLNLN